MKPVCTSTLLLALTLPACAHVPKACAVVEVAAASCQIVRYRAADGTVEELTAADVGDLVSAKKLARGRASKAIP